MEFSRKLKLLAGKHRYSQAMLAQRLGVSQNLVSLWMRGLNVPDLYEAATIARLFGVDVGYLSDDAIEEIPDASVAEQERAVLKLIRALNIDEAEVLRRLATPTAMPWVPARAQTGTFAAQSNDGRWTGQPGANDAVQGHPHHDPYTGEPIKPKPKRKRG